MYIVNKKESFEEGLVVFTDQYKVSDYDKAILVAAKLVLEYIIENTFMYSEYTGEDLSSLLSEDPEKVLAWLVSRGYEFFETFNVRLQVWVSLEMEVVEADIEDITVEEWIAITNILQRKLLGKTKAEA